MYLGMVVGLMRFCVCVFACVCVCMCVCVCICVCMSVRGVCVRMLMLVCIRICICAGECTSMYKPVFDVRECGMQEGVFFLIVLCFILNARACKRP